MEEEIEIQEETMPPSDEGGAPIGAEGEKDYPSVSFADSSPDKGSQANEALMEHIRSLAAQGQAFRETVPGFDLRRELRDPMFARLTSPQVGLSVEDAYYALHRRELQQQAARVAAGSISRAIQAGQLRPRENEGAQAGSVQTVDYSKATKQQREQLKQAIRNASARGEKVYP